MNARIVPWIAACLVVTTSAGSSGASAAPDARPNIVVILLDDLGYSDFGCYGGEIQTPNIDRLASGGLRFTRFYNASRCCPTRASLLTGLYPHQVGLAHNGRDLTRDGATIAELLRSSGYQTAMAGKWHLSETRPAGGRDDGPEHYAWLNHHADFDRPFANPATYPINRGFDRHYGTIWGVVDYFDPFSLVEGTKPVRDVPDDFYYTDAITEKSVESIRAMSRADRPFFLYVAHNAPHWPLHARPEDIARYRGKYDRGWHALREDRYRRQVAMGLVDPAKYPLPALMGNGPDWDALDAGARAQESALMEVHAAMVDRVDQGVGQIVAALRDAGKLDDTMIYVMADNGASPERYLNSGFDRSSETREGRPIRYHGRFEPGPEATWGYIGSHWANAANTPFRFWKVEAFEGGCHTPMIVSWPKGLSAPPGSTTDQVGHMIDLMPTCLEVAGVAYPREYDGHAIKPLEGKSLAPTFRGGTLEGDRTLFFEHEGGRAILAGDWKLVAQRGKGKPWELYHVSEDATETRDLAAREPKRVAEMATTWLRWAERVGADIPPEARRAASATRAPAAPRSIDLRAGQTLAGDEAPRVAGVPFRVEATVRDAGRGGVVVSQGGQVLGWSLYVRDRRPAFAVRRDGTLRELVADRTLGDGEAVLAAELRPDGSTHLLVDGVEVAHGDAGGLIPGQPADALIVGDDRLSAVASYETPRPFLGSILRARVETRAIDPPARGGEATPAPR